MLLPHDENEAAIAEFHLAQTMIRKTLCLVFPEGFAGIGMKAVGCVFDAPDHCLAHQERRLTRRPFGQCLVCGGFSYFGNSQRAFPVFASIA